MKYSSIHNYVYKQPVEKGFYTIEGKTIFFSDDTWNELTDLNVNDLWLTSLIYLSKDFESDDIDQAYTIYSSWRLRYATPEFRSEKPTSYCWNEISVTARLFVLSYLYSKKRTDDLYHDILNHLEWLITKENYVEKHNHGQYQDIAIVKFFNEYSHLFDIEADYYLTIANKRFTESICHCISDMGVHLEHSSAYHFTMLKFIELFLTNSDNHQLSDTRDKMKQIAHLLVYPDGTLPQLGDSYRTAGYQYKAKKQIFFDKQAGLMIYRSEKWDLFFTCWHHSQTHKQSDELNFELCYKNQRLFVDSGNYGFDYRNPFNQYARSLAGHNSLRFPAFEYDTRAEQPYGSGLLLVSEIKSGVICVGYNPHLLKKDILHIRILEINETSFFVTDYIINDYEEELEVETNFHLDESNKIDKVSRNEFIISTKNKKLHMFNGHGSQSVSRYHFDKEKMKGLYFPEDNTIAGNYQFLLEDKIQGEVSFTSGISEKNTVRKPHYQNGLYQSSNRDHTLDINKLVEEVLSC
ncbi:heparinase II/III domain-containing protein [Shewanella surugensis]|uniref:Heparinase II/III-family protein n=1 Tax=Shewanella surugensis TaxID=212020 RepID=A0ABT0LGM8_9GAMM|nr:heparinase II/III family protein [Shewanella surugensis]MCL1126844.1 heparinase II/III-family protein [Shewanella surugensis]